MAKIKMQTINLFKGIGLLNADEIEKLSLETEDGEFVDLAEVFANINGKLVEISIKAIDDDEVPYLNDDNEDNDEIIEDEDFIDEDIEIDEE